MNDHPVKPASVHIAITQTVQRESRDAIAHGLADFNAHHLGECRFANLDVYVRDADGRVVGGLIGEFCLGWFSIHALWVAGHPRGTGLGSGILLAAENAAIESGYRAALLDTLRFQAPAF
jgi:GNAT superfamily N-acetyltransferase